MTRLFNAMWRHLRKRRPNRLAYPLLYAISTMSDSIQHECGVSLLRLRKPLDYYAERYGTGYYGYEKLSLLLEKQHNRGQDGAGIACVGLDVPPGRPFYQLEKSCTGQLPLAGLLGQIGETIEQTCARTPETPQTAALALPFYGEVYLGHLRYGTYGGQSLAACQPMAYDSAWRNRTVLLAGNFNLTNTHQLFDQLVALGHHPRSHQDSELLLVELVHELGQLQHSPQGYSHDEIASLLAKTARTWDGGFAICGTFGNGDAFAFRDAHGIRPMYYHVDAEVAVVASERVAIQTTFNLTAQEVPEVPPGHVLTILANGDVRLAPCLPEAPVTRCVFERIYFSRGNDADIQRERRALGAALVPRVLQAIHEDYRNTVFSYIPNTALISYHGMLTRLSEQGVGHKVRFAQIAVKDAKFRTFITDAKHRKDLFPHVYDVTYGVVRPGQDNLVIIDDSIVRGNTMRNAILPILDRLQPKKIVVVSSAPPIRYPDCYGIDMASFGDLIAFEALVSLLKKHDKLQLFRLCVELAREDLAKSDDQMQNRAKPLYEAFSDAELEAEIGRLLRPANLHAELQVVFQTNQSLRDCCPNHTGDWYFTGNYPTPGGNRVVNRALVNYVENINTRAY